MEGQEDGTQTLPLIWDEGHLFLTLDGGDWIVDTGAVASFGDARSVTLCGRRFAIRPSYGDLTAERLSQYVHHATMGLLGADVLHVFDLRFDVPNGQLDVTETELECAGEAIPLETFMGVPIIPVTLQGKNRRLFFDTGAQISYVVDEDLLHAFPPSDLVTDFYPGLGPFQTTTHLVDILLGGCTITLRFGTLPAGLEIMLRMAKTEGVLGSAILRDHVIGFMPRRGRLVLASPEGREASQ